MGCLQMHQTNAQAIMANAGEIVLNLNAVGFDQSAWADATNGHARIMGTEWVSGFGKVFVPAVGLGAAVALRVYVDNVLVAEDRRVAPVVGDLFLSAAFSHPVIGGPLGAVVTLVVETQHAFTTNLDVSKRPHLFIQSCCDCDSGAVTPPKPVPITNPI